MKTNHFLTSHEVIIIDLFLTSYFILFIYGLMWESMVDKKQSYRMSSTLQLEIPTTTSQLIDLWCDVIMLDASIITNIDNNNDKRAHKTEHTDVSMVGP